MIVKNVKGSSRFNKPCTGHDSWLSYWEDNKGILSNDRLHKCPACREPVYKDELVGAHIQKVESIDKN